jgi:hypothetical protein
MEVDNCFHYRVRQKLKKIRFLLFFFLSFFLLQFCPLFVPAFHYFCNLYGTRIRTGQPMCCVSIPCRGMKFPYEPPPRGTYSDAAKFYGGAPTRNYEFRKDHDFLLIFLSLFHYTTYRELIFHYTTYRELIFL